MLVFLASAGAKKPEILMETFYACESRDFTQDILLTDKREGITYDFAIQRGMEVIVISDVSFQNFDWEDYDLDVGNAILVSCGWPYLIPEKVFSKFKAALNCHGSYLPDYRGSRAYMHYWANCSDYYGASIHYINKNFDDGNILVRAKQKLFMTDDKDVVFYRTAELCGIILSKAISMVKENHPGYEYDEVKRYFFKMAPEEFVEHRKMNEKRIMQGYDILLTRHKVLE